jgi:hypothetical protein
MKKIIVSILLLSATGAASADLKERVAGMPDDVRSWAWRQAGCNHWRGEAPVDADRARKIRESINDLRCNDLARDSEVLRRRYVNRRNILDLLASANELTPD